MNTTMQAAVVTAFGQPLVLQEWPIPTPGPGQVLVKTEAGGAHGVLITAPSLHAFRQGVGMTRKWGTCVLVGINTVLQRLQHGQALSRVVLEFAASCGGAHGSPAEAPR